MATKNRNEVAKALTSAQIAEARRRARNWKPRKEQTASNSKPNPQHKEPATSSGSRLSSATASRNRALNSAINSQNRALNSAINSQNRALNSATASRNRALNSATTSRRRVRTSTPASGIEYGPLLQPLGVGHGPLLQPLDVMNLLHQLQCCRPVLSIEEITLSKSVLDAAETATLSIRIKNVGPGDAHNLRVNLSSTSRGAHLSGFNRCTYDFQAGR